MQLLSAEVESKEVVTDMYWDLPCVSIKDQPRFAYRGFMLDACRHFIPVEDVKKQLDAMALFKLNIMHWHLTEDQGWRIEIKKYPRLAEIASKRIDGEGTEYGGYYTQEEIKEILPRRLVHIQINQPALIINRHRCTIFHRLLDIINVDIIAKHCWR